MVEFQFAFEFWKKKNFPSLHPIALNSRWVTPRGCGRGQWMQNPYLWILSPLHPEPAQSGGQWVDRILSSPLPPTRVFKYDQLKMLFSLNVFSPFSIFSLVNVLFTQTKTPKTPKTCPTFSLHPIPSISIPSSHPPSCTPVRRESPKASFQSCVPCAPAMSWS